MWIGKVMLYNCFRQLFYAQLNSDVIARANNAYKVILIREKNHCRRANYQCAIWKRSLDASPDVPDPVGNGWSLE